VLGEFTNAAFLQASFRDVILYRDRSYFGFSAIGYSRDESHGHRFLEGAES